MKFKEISVLLAVLLIVVMMVIPLPTILLDILLIINISLSITILLVGMNTKEPLDFSIFPSLLLLTTLFRLALNVSTTRSILSHGNAGHVVATFGEFVIGGNPVIGFIIFLILVIIQFLVITKGSERVAEVAARFTLDAMPGKQMSIDADLNAGLISEKDARMRREKVSHEADFYGAMDGASKFVKGDAIAGIIILFINVIGGFIIGMTMMGMDFSQAASTFTLLSVGDGLVSQIPALLISTATGIIVTRAASDGNLGDDLTRQLFAYPKLIYVVAGCIALFGLVTPIGILLTWSIAGLLVFAAYKMQKAKEKEAEQLEEVSELPMEEENSPENVLNLLQVDSLEFEFGLGLIPLADASQGGDILDRVIAIRKQIALELGLVIPIIRIRDNVNLESNQYAIKLKGNEIAGGEIFLNHFLMLVPEEEDHGILGIETVEPTFGLPALWINDEMRRKAEIFGYTVVDASSVITTHLAETIKRYAHEILGREETKQLIDKAKEMSPSIVEELVPSLLSIGQIQKVLQKLLKEKVSIRNLSVILETLADWAVFTKNPDYLTEYVRQSLSRQITKQLSVGNMIQVITVNAQVEKIISENLQETEQGMYLTLDPQLIQQLVSSLNETIGQVMKVGIQPIIMTSPAIRMYVKQIVGRINDEIPVISFNELESNVEVQNIGVVHFQDVGVVTA
ncbi:flagellar biosynthesis protein FlhA [Neobacillus bataviensis LMG 21833]|uniref:Flagellar biosynthesis protein FlhA n=1 Tax=Neobacillus bataviensis LMG 21833 TaxID=1117379 RepID=K6D5V3_9BACI|nr:flagellar biosynthesis protein FlhA [Neobacillus bataviensis]EKN63674.1 flagellar biosynthesis protein FlhA [Neobacillus bataviensis LMG 21833]